MKIILYPLLFLFLLSFLVAAEGVTDTCLLEDDEVRNNDPNGNTSNASCDSGICDLTSNTAGNGCISSVLSPETPLPNINANAVRATSAYNESQAIRGSDVVQTFDGSCLADSNGDGYGSCPVSRDPSCGKGLDDLKA